jgi:hypothetical protein
MILRIRVCHLKTSGQRGLRSWRIECIRQARMPAPKLGFLPEDLGILRSGEPYELQKAAERLAGTTRRNSMQCELILPVVLGGPANA